MDSILSRTASVSSTHLGPGRNKLFIRGIADSSFTGPTQSTVGQYFGDIRLSYNAPDPDLRSEEHTSELQSLMRISYAVFCLKKKTTTEHITNNIIHITNL